MTFPSSPWVNPLPGLIEPAGESCAKALLSRFSTLAEQRTTLAGSSRSAPERRVILWPRPPLKTRLLPSGVTPWDELSEGDMIFGALRRILFDTKVAVWGYGHENSGLFIGEYSKRLCQWIKGELIFSPSVMISCTYEMIMICDEQLHYSTVGLSPELVRRFDEALGGREKSAALFRSWVEAGEIGFDADDRQWAQDTLLDEP
jgi:hypothetical protein